MKKNINDYVKMLIHSTKAQCLIEALELKLFDAIDGKTKTERIANDLNVEEKNLKILLEALVFLDLLYFENGFFTLTKIAKVYFFTNSTQYIGDMFTKRHAIIKQHNEHLGKLLSNKKSQNINTKKEIPALATNKDLNPNNQEKLWAKAADNHLKQEQTLRKDFALKSLLRLKDFPKSGKILDLGCSAGLTIIDITKQFPDLKIVLFDFEEVIEAAKKNIKNHKYINNISTMAGNINEDDIGKDYDLIWCSHVMYFLTNPKEILKKIYNALNPNGIFVSYHTEIDKTDEKYKDNFFYFMYLALQNRKIFEPLELVDNLEEVGFKTIISFENPHDLAVASQVIIARK